MRLHREDSPTPNGTAFRIGRAACAALLTLVAVYAVEALVGTGGRLDSFFDNRIYYALLVGASSACVARAIAVRAERVPWLLLAGALTLWTIGDFYYYVVFSGNTDVPIPSVADGFTYSRSR